LIEWGGHGWNHESETAEGLHHQRNLGLPMPTVPGPGLFSFLLGNVEWMQTGTMAKRYPNIINPTKR